MPPGSQGERVLQRQYGSVDRANEFYDTQMHNHLNDRMVKLIERQEMMFIATSDAKGECDSSFRAGFPGFVIVLDDKTLIYPEYRGNGVYASLGNISENPHVGMLFVDFFESTIGLHVNGKTKVIDNEQMMQRVAATETVCEAMQVLDGPQPERWILVTVEEAYIHCAKHVPRLEKVEKKIHWGSDDDSHKGGRFFDVSE
ncbi:MAG: pyridoxamine 5-phosphate oxidase [Planctomycetaceae bacterium]|jgi:uncharacterized protein|nr:pyridoxamine 5-phosphate oxidase [Planctomycetaceae bacterium]